jgi:hypothetical protein
LTLQDFHKFALNRPDALDMAVLYDLAKEEVDIGDTPVEDIKFQPFSITSFETRLEAVFTHSKDVAMSIWGEFDPNLEHVCVCVLAVYVIIIGCMLLLTLSYSLPSSLSILSLSNS